LDGDGELDEYGTRRGVLRGDFGFSFRTRKPVLEENLPATIEHRLFDGGHSAGGIDYRHYQLGSFLALKQYSSFDIAATTFSFAGQANPRVLVRVNPDPYFLCLVEEPFHGRTAITRRRHVFSWG